MKDRSRIISFTTTCAMLVLMACIGLYYMQYDYDAVAYIKAFSYLVMAVSSIVALVITSKEEGKRELTFAVAAFSVLMMISAIFSLVPILGNYALFVSYVAIAFVAPFILCFVAKLATGKDIFEKSWLKAILLIVSIVTVIAFLLVNAVWLLTVVKILFALWALIFVAGTVFAIINIIKKRETFINWSYLFFVLPYAAIYAQRVLNVSRYMKTLEGIALLSIAFFVVALVCKEEVKTNKK